MDWTFNSAHFVISALLAGNEKADELAKAGAVCDNTVAVLPPKIELKSQIKEHFYSDFTEYDGARMGKQFYFGPDPQKAKYVIKLSRAKLARFVRIISGHNYLFYFRHLVDNDIDPLCRFCLEENETFEHLVNECPRFHLDRQDKLLGQLILNDHLWSVQTLLDFSFIPGINDVLEGDTRIELFLGYDDTESSVDSISDTSLDSGDAE